MTRPVAVRRTASREIDISTPKSCLPGPDFKPRPVRVVGLIGAEMPVSGPENTPSGRVTRPRWQARADRRLRRAHVLAPDHSVTRSAAPSRDHPGLGSRQPREHRADYQRSSDRATCPRVVQRDLSCGDGERFRASTATAARRTSPDSMSSTRRPSTGTRPLSRPPVEPSTSVSTQPPTATSKAHHWWT